MNKKIISLVLALVMVLGTFTSVFAAETTTKKAEAKKAEAGEKVEKVVGKDNKIQYVIDKKLVEGYEDGNYGLDKNIKRSEITRLLVLANGNEELAKQLQGSMKIYSDVDAKHWANGVISVGTTVPSDANGIAMLAGYPDGSFKPENDVTYAELAKMLVVLAKEDLTADMVKNAKWATSWMTWAAQLGILDDVNVVDSNKAANRADAFTMVYNALYKMAEFKRVPANETRGIISNFTKDVLTLNQDSKMEYKITDETVFVTGKDAERQQIQRIKKLDVKVRDYYLGSLVRILTNDKNEVTHIIELGNPAYLAKNNAFGTVKADNSVWRGVADNTVETEKTGEIKSANDAKFAARDAYATIEFKNNSNIDAKRVVFHNLKDAKDKLYDLTLKINDDTEFYVANPGNNQMKKVANVNEALSLIGFQNYKNYKIAGVYAGFDTDGLDRNWKGIKFNDAERNTAKVVVFNLVNKEAEGERYRVIESSSSKFGTTIENVDGKLFDRDNVNDTSRFPLEYGDKFDVIELDDVRAGSRYTTLIDHSKTETYPIVKITKVDDDKKFIEIEDLNGEKSFLDIRDADIFSAERYGKLEEGNHIQFAVNDLGKDNKGFAQYNSNEADVISLLGTKVELKGSLVDVIPTADKAQRVGKLVEVKNVNGVYHMVVKVDYNLFDEADKNGYATYIVADEYVEGLKANIGEKISFKVFERNHNGLYIATDIRLNNEDQTLIPNAKANVEEAQRLINKAINTKADEVGYDEIKAAEDAWDKLTTLEKKEIVNKAEYQTAKENAVANQKKVANKAIDAFVEALDKDVNKYGAADENTGKPYVDLKNATEVKEAKASLENIVKLQKAAKEEVDKFNYLVVPAGSTETIRIAIFNNATDRANGRIKTFDAVVAKQEAFNGVTPINVVLEK